MTTTFRDMQVSVNISDVDGEELYPERVVVLQHPDWFINVGRGNSIDETLMPQPHNTWFASRVMSRHHATLTADPGDRLLFITDAGSMHGTLINGSKITANQPYRLVQGDIITFGSQVVRGDDVFLPLKVSIHFDWSENERGPQLRTYPNSFTADYSEEDIDMSDEDEVQIIRESFKQPSVEVLEHGFEQSSSVSTSPSLDSEQSLPSSESDPVSLDQAEVEEDQAKEEHTEDNMEQDQQSHPADTESNEHMSPDTDVPSSHDISQSYYTKPFATNYYFHPPHAGYQMEPPSHPVLQAPLYLPDPMKLVPDEFRYLRPLHSLNLADHTSTKKRKADEISDGHEATACTDRVTQYTSEMMNTIHEQTSESNINHIIKPVNTAPITIASITHPQEEASSSTTKESEIHPPTIVTTETSSLVHGEQQRKIKRTKIVKSSNTTSQVVKYAATAFAGAAIGAIGTVFGLAALPPDFFA